jgi:hypothetical protein
MKRSEEVEGWVVYVVMAFAVAVVLTDIFLWRV